MKIHRNKIEGMGDRCPVAKGLLEGKTLEVRLGSDYVCLDELSYRLADLPQCARSWLGRRKERIFSMELDSSGS